MKRLILTLAVLALAAPVGAADIVIPGSPDITHTTSADENTAGLYYQTQYDDNLCLAVGEAAGCSLAEYEAACALETTPACETFYARTAQGAKEFFMDTVIKAALAQFVASRESDVNTGARTYWDDLTLAQKEAQCAAWGLDATCKP